MSQPKLDKLRVKLIPEYNGSGEAVALLIHYVIENLNVEEGKTLVMMSTRRGRNEGPNRIWLVKRRVAGDVQMHFRAVPRQLHALSDFGSRVDFRAESRGLQGRMSGLLPVPLDLDEKNRKIWTMVVEWDLKDAPSGTRAVWSLGEGPSPVESKGPSHELASTWIMVGDIGSFPPQSDVASYNESFYRLFYFGTPPENIMATAQQNALLFPKMSECFQDLPSKTNPYHVFVRNAAPVRGFGGSGLTRSYMLEYDETAPTITQDEITSLLSYEMVHNWPLMEYRFQTSSYVDQNIWFNEDYYGSILPYRFGRWSKKTFLDRVNGKMLSYFVNPLLNISNREAQKNIRSGSSFNQYLHYNRGFNHLLKLDYQIRTASSGKRSINIIVLPLLQRRKDKQYFGLEGYLSLLRAELGEQGIQDHNEMTQGNTILPVDGALGPGFKVVRDDKAPVELGFDESTMTARIVKGLKPKSRAAEAGLREGDVLVKMAFLWQLNKDYEKMIWMDVKRDDEVVHIKYWPRATEKVPCWQWVEV